MYKCDKCNKEFEKRHAYIAHCRVHSEYVRPLKINSRTYNKKYNIEKKICPHCNQKFDNGRSLGGHMTHCKKNPKYGEIRENMIKSNRNKEFKWSDEDKKRISEQRKKYLNENPDKVPYKLNHYSRGSSYPEKYFEIIFKENNLSFIKELPISYYSLDFVFNGKINVEIDGEQHYVDKRIFKSNKERDRYLGDLGWKIIRIRWSYYQKLNKNEKEFFIKKIINYINHNKFEFNVNNLLKEKKYYCNNCGDIITNRGKTNLCHGCYSKQNRKVERPPQEQLFQEIKELGYSATGRKYGVSDNAVRKWVKSY